MHGHTTAGPLHQRKLALGFGTVCLLLLAAIGLGLQTLHTSQATVSSMSDVVVPG